ncbi:MAG: hypothetical protein IJ439_06705 [Tyzzerella sp.]|nr:hypothetical protein [Tyzzerella sp.]
MKRGRRLTQELNTMDRSDLKKINEIIQELFGKADESTFVNPPFYCEYGTNIEVGSIVTKDIPDCIFAVYHKIL